MAAYRCNPCVGFQVISLRLLLYHIGKNNKNYPHFAHTLRDTWLCQDHSSFQTRFFSFRNNVFRKHTNELNGHEDEKHENPHELQNESQETSDGIENCVWKCSQCITNSGVLQ